MRIWEAVARAVPVSGPGCSGKGVVQKHNNIMRAGVAVAATAALAALGVAGGSA